MRWTGTLAATAAAMLFSAHAATLREETLQAWDDYVQGATARMQDRLRGSSPFLWSSESPERMRRITSGEIVAIPMSAHSPVKVPNGLIHDWMGAAWLGNTTLDEALAVTQDYASYKDFYKPLVVDSRQESRTERAGEDDYHFSLVMVNNSLLAKRAIQSEWTESYKRIDSRHAYSIAQSTQVIEIENYGSDHQRVLPENEGSGYLWRLYAISRLEQRDNGVYVELEVMALSRDVPGVLRWAVDPIIRRVSKASLVTSLTKTRAAVNGAGNQKVASSRLSIAPLRQQ